MSKFLGKLLSKANVFELGNVKSCKVMFLKTKNQFKFIVDFDYGAEVVCVNANLFSQMCLIDSGGGPDFFYKFSIGYSVRARVGVESIGALRNNEMAFLASACGVGDSKRDLILSDFVSSDFDFDLISFCQFAFNIPFSLLPRIMGANSKRHKNIYRSAFVDLKKRDMNSLSGRKPGSKNQIAFSSIEESETLQDKLFRVNHNKQIAIAKNSFQNYFLACKELDPQISRDLCLKDFQNCRKIFVDNN